MNLFMKRAAIALVSALFIFSLFSFSTKETIPDYLESSLPVLFSAIGLLLVLAGFSERGDARRAWLFVAGGQAFITLSVSSNTYMPFHQVVIYLSGVTVAAVGGYLCLSALKRNGENLKLNTFHGLSYTKTGAGFVFLVCALALAGFPLTPTFLGIDLLFTHLHEDQILLTAFTALSFIFIELAVIRIYGRLFMGPTKKHDHPIALRSS